MAGPAVEEVNVSDQAKLLVTSCISELAQEYDLSHWHVFIYGYPERSALEVTITAPDRIKVQRQFTERQLTAVAIRRLVEAQYDRWRSRTSRG